MIDSLIGSLNSGKALNNFSELDKSSSILFSLRSGKVVNNLSTLPPFLILVGFCLAGLVVATGVSDLASSKSGNVLNNFSEFVLSWTRLLLTIFLLIFSEIGDCTGYFCSGVKASSS